ncbi:MAG: AMP-binding protein, partial [bacterium]
MNKTLTRLFTDHITKTGMSKETFFTKVDDEYIPLRNKDLIHQIYNVINFFRDHNLKDGDKVAIISENCTEWVAVDFACMFMKLISIPIYTSQSLLQIEYILDNSESAICFVSNTNLLGKVMQLKNNLPSLKDVVAFKNTDTSEYENERISLFSEIVNKHDF